MELLLPMTDNLQQLGSVQMRQGKKIIESLSLEKTSKCLTLNLALT